MSSFSFINFTFVQILKNKTKYLPIFILSSFIVTVLSSFIFISNSIEHDIKITVDNQPDLTVQQLRSGKLVDISNEWLDEFLEFEGIENGSLRVYGKYFYEPAEEYFTIVGVDFFDEQTSKSLKKLVEGIDIQEFTSGQNMIIGSGVKEFLDHYHYFDYYNFRPPDRSIEKIYIYDTFTKNSDMVSSDMIIMDIDIARKVLGISEDRSTDIVLNVPNQEEIETLRNKIRAYRFDVRILSKDDFIQRYTKFFDYKSSIFLLLYIIVIFTFVLILYQRYSIISSVDRKEIGILRALGWNISSIIYLKLLENCIIFILSFVAGVNLAYIYVFIFDAPILNKIFLGFSNLSTSVSFTPVIDFGTIIMIFVFYIIPVIASILIPVWRISIIEPHESIR
ncbi:MAG: FtsX-like permease family protein [Campylobacterota bacterium]|nr:FtsX-like permease family protein [Campylobacterota bacterium]